MSGGVMRYIFLTTLIKSYFASNVYLRHGISCEIYRLRNTQRRHSMGFMLRYGLRHARIKQLPFYNRIERLPDNQTVIFHLRNLILQVSTTLPAQVERERDSGRPVASDEEMRDHAEAR